MDNFNTGNATADLNEINSAEAPETANENFSEFSSNYTYDPAKNPELDEIRLRLNSKPLDTKWISDIRQAAGKKNFPLELQFEAADMNKATFFTLGDLAATATHEKAVQYIYPKRVEHILFGPHGIAKGHKLSNELQVTWRREPYTGEIEATPCITSGRHRLTAIILLLQHLGINWEKQKVMVSTKIANSDEQFAQLIFDNNDCRKMVQAEKRNHKLGALGINTANEEAFYRSSDSVRRARSNVCAQAFGAACRFRATDKPQAYQDRLYQYASGAYTKLVKVRENRDFMRDLIQMKDVSGDALEAKINALQEAATFVADNLLTSIAKGREKFPLAYECHSAPKALSLMLADYLSITAPSFEESK